MTQPNAPVELGKMDKKFTAESDASTAASPNDHTSEQSQLLERFGLTNFASNYMLFLHYLRGDHRQVRHNGPTLLHKCVAEAFGTGLIIICGLGCVNAAVFTGAQSGIWQVATIWAFGVILAILTTASVSGAHLNPAVTFAFALLRPDDFSPMLVLPYWISQMFGALMAALINYGIFSSVLNVYEAQHDIIRGQPKSVLSAQVFGMYFPNPGYQYSTDNSNEAFGEIQQGALGWDSDTTTASGSFGLEALGTAILMLVVMSTTDPRNSALVSKDMAPYFIGFTVAVLVSIWAPLNSSGYNPARDFGPRLAAYFLGWGEVAIPGPKGGFWVYILGPMFGAPMGGAFYDFVLRPPKSPKE